ncbi:MAG: hypothetical protein H7Y33_10230 [Cytophagales bacterium]|nr:hypothetical protein [Rhizobacter sp.]
MSTGWTAGIWRWPLLLTLGLVPQAARAEQWVLENSLSSRYESNDNAALAHTSPGTMNTLSLSTAFTASRKTERSATRVNGAVSSLTQWGPGERDRVDGQLGLAQTLSDPLNSFSLSFTSLQDFNSTVDTADVTVSRGRRRSKTLTSAWSHVLTERMSANTQLTLNRTAYGQAVTAAVDYRNAALSGGLSYRWSEISTLSLDASRSEYRTEADTNRSTTDQIGLGWASVLAERHNVSLSLGVYRTKTAGLRGRLVCPLAPAFCDAGFVQPEVATERAYSTGQGLQFSLSERYQFNETTDFSFSAARQQTPSGAGVVVRNDSLRASANHSFSPTLTGSMGFAQTRSTYPGLEGAPAPAAQQSFSVSMTKQLAIDLSLHAGYQFNRADGARPGLGARANSVSLSLQYDWPRLDVAR